jgi:hypothetical protein
MAIEGTLRTWLDAQLSQTDAVKSLIYRESPHLLSIVRVWYTEAQAARDAIRRELQQAEVERDRRAEDLRRSALAVIAAHAADIGLPAEVDRLQCAALDAGMRLMWLVQEGAMGII